MSGVGVKMGEAECRYSSLPIENLCMLKPVGNCFVFDMLGNLMVRMGRIISSSPCIRVRRVILQKSFYLEIRIIEAIAGHQIVAQTPSNYFKTLLLNHINPAFLLPIDGRDNILKTESILLYKIFFKFFNSSIGFDFFAEHLSNLNFPNIFNHFISEMSSMVWSRFVQISNVIRITIGEEQLKTTLELFSYL